MISPIGAGFPFVCVWLSISGLKICCLAIILHSNCPLCDRMEMTHTVWSGLLGKSVSKFVLLEIFDDILFYCWCCGQMWWPRWWCWCDGDTTIAMMDNNNNMISTVWGVALLIPSINQQKKCHTHRKCGSLYVKFSTFNPSPTTTSKRGEWRIPKEATRFCRLWNKW